MNALNTALSPIRRPGRSALEIQWRNFGFRPYPAAPVRLINFVAGSDCPNCGVVGSLELRSFLRGTESRSLIICRTCGHVERLDCCEGGA